MGCPSDVSLKEYIEFTFGSQAGMDRALGWTDRTAHRYYNSTPSAFMKYHVRLRESIDLNLLSQLIAQRESEILAGQSDLG